MEHWGIAMTLKNLQKLLSAYPDDMEIKMCLYWGSGYSEHNIGGVIEAQEWEEGNLSLWIYDEDNIGADTEEGLCKGA